MGIAYARALETEQGPEVLCEDPYARRQRHKGTKAKDSEHVTTMTISSSRTHYVLYLVQRSQHIQPYWTCIYAQT